MYVNGIQPNSGGICQSLFVLAVGLCHFTSVCTVFVFVGTLNELVVVVVGGPLVVDAGTAQTNSVQANSVIISL